MSGSLAPTRASFASRSKALPRGDLGRFEATLRRLDREEARAHERRSPTPGAEEAVAYLQALRTRWVGTDDEGRKLFAAALLERVGVLGEREVRITPTVHAEAEDLAAPFAGPVACSTGTYGRGERSRTVITDLNVRSSRL